MEGSGYCSIGHPTKRENKFNKRNNKKTINKLKIIVASAVHNVSYYEEVSSGDKKDNERGREETSS